MRSILTASSWFPRYQQSIYNYAPLILPLIHAAATFITQIVGLFEGFLAFID